MCARLKRNVRYYQKNQGWWAAPGNGLHLLVCDLHKDPMLPAPASLCVPSCPFSGPLGGRISISRLGDCRRNGHSPRKDTSGCWPHSLLLPVNEYGTWRVFLLKLDYAAQINSFIFIWSSQGRERARERGNSSVMKPALHFPAPGLCYPYSGMQLAPPGSLCFCGYTWLPGEHARPRREQNRRLLKASIAVLSQGRVQLLATVWSCQSPVHVGILHGSLMAQHCHRPWLQPLCCTATITHHYQLQAAHRWALGSQSCWVPSAGWEGWMEGAWACLATGSSWMLATPWANQGSPLASLPDPR